MGEYADDHLEHELEEAAFWLMREAEQKEKAENLERNNATMQETSAELEKLGLKLVRKSEYHYHVTRNGRVVAQWYPSSGVTMDGQRRGQRCNTGKQLVAWMRDKLRKESRRG
jgi:hypothetical protein